MGIFRGPSRCQRDRNGECLESGRIPILMMCLQLTRDKPAADERGTPGLALELVLPGVTVPWAHALYLWIATAVSLGVHEVHLSHTALHLLTHMLR